MSDIVKIIVVRPNIRIMINTGIPGPPPTDAQIIAALDNLSEYSNDADATIAGKTWYITGAGHESLPYGVLKKALT